MLGLHHGKCQLGSRYALARDYHTDYGRVESELSFHIWRQKAANAKGQKLQMMKGLFSGKLDKPGSSLMGSVTPAGCLEAHLGLLSCGGVCSFSFTRIAKRMNMLEGASRGQQHMHEEWCNGRSAQPGKIGCYPVVFHLAEEPKQ